MGWNDAPVVGGEAWTQSPEVPPENINIPALLEQAKGNLAETGKNVLGFGTQIGRNMVGGFGRSMNGLDSILKTLPIGQAQNLLSLFGRKAAGLPQMPSNQENAAAMEKLDPTLPADAGWPSKLMEAGSRGVGGAMVAPVPGAGVFPNMFPGFVGGMGGYAGEQYAKDLPPIAQKTLPILASIIPAVMAGYALGPRQTAGQSDIRKSLSDTPPSTFADAAENLRAAARSGSTTQTAAEAFPPNSPLMTLAEKTRNAGTDNALKDKTTLRPDDIARLTQTSLDRIAPANDGNQVANQTSAAADGVIQNAKNARDTAIGNRLGAEAPILPQNVKMIEDYLLSEANASGVSPSRQAAFREAAARLRDAHGQLYTSPQDISLALVGMENAPKNPNFTGFQGRSVEKYDVNDALNRAREAVSSFRPGFGDALTDFKNYSQQVLNPMRAGPVGSISNRNPVAPGQTPLSRLNSILVGNSPKTIRDTASTISDPAMTPAPVDPLDIARAIAEQKLAGRPGNPGETLRGSPGSPKEANFRALLEAGGANADHVMEPLGVADKLQRFNKPPGDNTPPRMSLMQGLIRPFRTLDMALTSQSTEGVNREVANLLARNDPKIIGELQKIAMFEPGVRRALTLRGVLVPLANSQNGGQ